MLKTCFRPEIISIKHFFSHKSLTECLPKRSSGSINLQRLLKIQKCERGIVDGQGTKKKLKIDIRKLRLKAYSAANCSIYGLNISIFKRLK